jgi:hypothetical protein
LYLEGDDDGKRRFREGKMKKTMQLVGRKIEKIETC